MTVAAVQWMNRGSDDDDSPDWALGLCTTGYDPEIFFLEDREDEARAVCDLCPIKWECLSWSIEQKIEFGVWGGMPESRRQPLRFRRHRVRCPHCGSRSVERSELVRSEVCVKCGLSWLI